MTSRNREGATLDSILDELTDLALTAPPSREFFLAVLNSAIAATHAHSGAIWSVIGENYRLEQEIGLVQLGIGNNSALQAIHEEALECATRLQSPARPLSTETGLEHATQTRLGDELVTSRDGTHADSDIVITNRTFDENLYQFFGCRDQDATYLVIELVRAADGANSRNSGEVANLMAALSEIARDFRNAQALQRLQLQDSIWNEFNAILPKLHSSIQLDQTTFQVANLGRTFLGADRVSVAIKERGNWNIQSVSAVASIEKRAKQVRELESLVSRVAVSGVSLRFPVDGNESPYFSEQLHRYLDESSCEKLWVRLLDRQGVELDSDAQTREVFGAIAIEMFSTSAPVDLERRSDLLVQHSQIAISNALSHSRMPLRSVSEFLATISQSIRSYRFKILCIVGVVALLASLALLIPSDLNIDAKGTIQPIAMHHLFAPTGGEVVQIFPSHQSVVKKGDVLVVIRNRELELRKEELLTQRATTQEKLRGIEVARLRDRKPSTIESTNLSELSASERELREVLKSQDEQLTILNELLQSLQLRSPIDGQVISWDPEQTLERRPVQQGQKLLSVANREGAGRLQLRVLDEDTRHIVNAMKTNGVGKVQVTFSIASDPGVRHSAVLHQIGTIIETVTDEGASIRVDAIVPDSKVIHVHPGATVFAKIHCGKTSIGYVWTRRLCDFLLLRFY